MANSILSAGKVAKAQRVLSIMEYGILRGTMTESDLLDLVSLAVKSSYTDPLDWSGYLCEFWSNIISLADLQNSEYDVDLDIKKNPPALRKPHWIQAGSMRILAWMDTYYEMPKGSPVGIHGVLQGTGIFVGSMVNDRPIPCVACLCRSGGGRIVADSRLNNKSLLLAELVGLASHLLSE